MYVPDELRRVMRDIEMARRQAEPYGRILQEVARAVSGREGILELARAVEDSQRILKDIGSVVRAAKFQNFFQTQEDFWRETARPLAETLNLKGSLAQRIQESSLVWQISMSEIIGRFQDVGFLQAKEELSIRLLEPQRIYTEFVAATVERTRKESEEAARALRFSLRLAEVQLLTTTEALSSVITVPCDEESPSPPRTLNLPVIQQEELLALPEIVDENYIEPVIKTIPSAQLHSLSREVLRSVVKCNELSKTKGGEEIFKPTTRLLEVFSDFSWLAATDRQILAEFVDCLYFVFYEGAGADNLRFISTHGGPFEDDDCEFIWCVKHLRNKWLRHDPDHGEEADVRKSWLKLGDNFKWLGLKHPPSETAQFRLLQRALLEKANTFVHNLLQKLESK